MNSDPNQPGQSSPSSPNDPTIYGLPPIDQPYFEQTPIHPIYPPAAGLPPYAQPTYAVPSASQPPKKSRRGLWIALSIIGGVLVLSCIGCSFLAVYGFGALKQFAGPSITATAYYQAIKSQNYTRAFSYLDSNGASLDRQAVTEDLFISAARLVDTLKGPVASFKYVSEISDTDTAKVVTVTVIRNSSSYNVHLRMVQVGDTWKITHIDNI